MTSTSLRPLRWPNRTTPSTVANRVSSPPRRTLSPGWNLVPRWRTMIVPARTFVPVVTFTPRRWEAESRPFLEDAAPFFFDMSANLRLLGRPLLGGRLLRRRRSLLGRCLPRSPARRDARDLDQRVPLPVTPALPVVGLGLVGEP